MLGHAPSIASTYAPSVAEENGESEEDELTVKHKRNPKRAFELDTILASFGLASQIFNTQVKRNKRRFVVEGTKILVDDQRFTGHSFKFFSVNHPMRYAAIRVITSRNYRSRMAFLYALSAVMLLVRGGRNDHFPNDTWVPGQYVALVVDRILLLFFVLDLIMSCVAHGVLKCMRQNSYILDALMIGSSIAQEVVNNDQVSLALFAISALRPLRIVSRIKSMMKLIDILTACSAKLLQVGLLIIGICVVFAIAAVILFRDASHTRCYDPTQDTWGPSCNVNSLSDPTAFLYAPCAQGTFCTTDAPNLPVPNVAGSYSYDNIGYAMLILLQTLTLDNWTPLAVDMMGSLTPAAGIFFVVSTFLLAYWATNQFTAVIFDSFSTTFVQEKELEDRRTKAATDVNGGDEDGAIDNARNFSSAKGTAPHAQRSFARLKQSIAVDSVRSLQRGIRSVNPIPFIKDEARRAAARDAKQHRDSRGVDFFLDSDEMNGLMDVQYKYTQLESTLPEPAQHMLEAIKENRFKSDRERNIVLNHFHSMSDGARAKMLRFLEWRSDIEGSDHPNNHNLRGLQSLSEPLLSSPYVSPYRIDFKDTPKRDVHDEFNRRLQGDDDVEMELWSECSFADSNDAGEGQPNTNTTLPIAISDGRPQRRPRSVQWKDDVTLTDHLSHLKQEHQSLWAAVSPVLDEVRRKRAEMQKVKTQRQHVDHKDPRSRREEKEESSTRSNDSSSSASSSSTSSSSASSTSSQDTLDRALAMHERLAATNERRRVLESKSLQQMAVASVAQVQAVSASAMRVASTGLRTLRQQQNWKRAKSLDEAIEHHPHSQDAENSAGHHPVESVFDRTLSVEEHREANKLLLHLLREYNDHRIQERPQPSLWQRITTCLSQQQPKFQLYTLIRSPLYERAIMIGTGLNCLLLMAVYDGSPPQYDDFLDVVSGVMDVWILFDTIARIALTSLTTYLFMTRRNVFNVVEFLVFLLCGLDLFAGITNALPFVRTFRVLRGLKFMRRSVLLRQILALIRTSLGYLINVLLLQVLLWLVFTYSGRQLFGEAFHSVDLLQPCNTYTTKLSCNHISSNCIWVNQQEWMTWNNTYMMELKGQSRTQSSTISPSLAVTKSLESRSIQEPSISHSEEPSVSLTHTRNARYNVTPAPPTSTKHNASTTPPPPPSVLPSTSIPPPTPASTYYSNDGNRTCRQFQGWDSISPFSRFSFETLTFAFVTVFDIVTKDNWSTIMYSYMSSVGSYSFIFFVAVNAVCGYLILSLQVAILLVNFEQRDVVNLEFVDDDIELFDQEVIVSHGKTNPLRSMASERLAEHLLLRDAATEAKMEQERVAKEELHRMMELAKEREMVLERQRAESLLREKQQQLAAQRFEAAGKNEEEETAVANWKLRLSRIFTLSEETKNMAIVKAFFAFWSFLLNFTDAEPMQIKYVEGKSLFLFPSTSSFRQFAVRFVQGEYFPIEKAIFWLGLVHCFVSPASSKLMEEQALLEAFAVIDWILVVMSVVEMLLRLVASGAFMGPHAYVNISGTTGRIDLAAVAISTLANVLPPLINGFSSGAYRGAAIGFALKGVRTSRVVSRSTNMRNVVVAVWMTVPDLLSFMGLCFVFIMMYNTICVHAFRGRIRRCSDGSDRSMDECAGSWVAVAGTPSATFLEFPPGMDTLILPRTWTNMNGFHFDDVWNGFTTLLQVALVSSWGQVVYAIVDCPDVSGGSPIRNGNPASVGWMILWVIISNNFLLNIFVGAVVDRFSKLKDQLQGNLFISAEQSEIVRIKKSLVTKTAKKVLRLPTTPFIDRRLNEVAFAVVSHRYFLLGIKYLLYMNTIIIMTIHYQQDHTFDKLQSYGNAIISFAFIVEGCLKVGVAGVEAYFSIKFHLVEAAVIVQSLIEIAYFVAGLSPPVWLQLLRLIRVVRLVRDAKDLRKILHTGYKSLPAMGNIGAVLIAVLFVFSMIGIALFEDIRYDLTGLWFSPMFSLRTVPKAMFLLYTVATQDDWTQVQLIVGVRTPNCLTNYNNCGDMALAMVFLDVFVIAVALILLNLFMAVVLENFSDAVLLPQYLEERQKDVEAFRRAWSRFDNGRNVIHASSMVPLLQSLPGPQQRFDLLKDTRENAADDDSAHSLQSEEMRVYAETQTIGLGGCPAGSIIPTMRQLKLVVTLPQEEILYLDAIGAIGEKIYHAQLVDERVRRAQERVLVEAEETQISFALWFATTRFQKVFRERLHQQKKYAQLVEEDKALPAELYPNKPQLPPRHIASGSQAWNSVLDPIVVSFVRQHFRSAWTTDGSNTKMRKITLTRRVKDDDAEADEDDEVKKQKLAILDEVGKRQTKSLAATIKERQVEVEEAPEATEDTTWTTIIQELTDDDDRLVTTSLAQQKSSRDGGAFGKRLELKRRVDLETGAICHVPTLGEIIQAQRQELLFQIFAASFKKRTPLDFSAMRELSSQTTAKLRHQLADGDEIALNVWTSVAHKWTPRRLRSSQLIPQTVWRVELQLPKQPRSLFVQKKKKTTQQHQQQSGQHSNQSNTVLVSDWGTLYRISDSSILDRCLLDDEDAADDIEISATLPLPTIDAEDLEMSPAESTSLRPRSGTIGNNADAKSFSKGAMSITDANGRERLPTLRERMDQLGMKTTLMRKSEETHERSSEVSRQQQPRHLEMGSLFANATHRSSVPSVRLIVEEGVELSQTAKDLYRMTSGDENSHRWGAFTTSNTAGSYDIPKEEDSGLPKLSFAVMTRLSMAARRFKRRKMEAEAEALRNKVKLRGAASVYSRVSKGQATNDGADSTATPHDGSPKTAANKMLGMFKKVGAFAVNAAVISKKKVGEGSPSSPSSPPSPPGAGGHDRPI